MEHIDLTISTGYVPDWGFWEGARELVQNAFDRERETAGGKDLETREGSEYAAKIEYDEERSVMTVENATSSIERRTLLLGEGTKRQGGETIGQHGEGYKLALLALLRSGHEVAIQNGAELWTPTIVRHEALDVDVLRVEFRDNLVDQNALRFIVTNVTRKEWAAVVCNVRRLHDVGDEADGDGGTLLYSEAEMGRLYVGGLFVKMLHERFLYGYDFDPDRVHLDRDRSTVDSFHMAWECGRLARGLGPESEGLLLAAIEKEAEDSHYLLSGSGSMVDLIQKSIYAKFRAEFGALAFPIKAEQDSAYIRKEYSGVRTIVVKESVWEAITESDEFKEWKAALVRIEHDLPHVILRNFLVKHVERFPQILADAFASELIDRAEDEHWDYY